MSYGTGISCLQYCQTNELNFRKLKICKCVADIR